MKTSFIFSFLFLFLSCAKISNELCSFESDFRIIDYAGLFTYSNIEDGMKCSVATGKPIFLLFTGYACVGDTSYEEFLFIKKECRSILSENYIPVVLYVDEKKSIPQSLREKMNLGKDDFKIKNFGHFHARYQESKFLKNTQPYFVVLDSIGNPIFDPIGYQSDKQNYTKFILKGIEEYQKRKQPIKD